MTNSHDDMIEFYKDAVRISTDERGRLDTARDTCVGGVSKGLTDKGGPQIRKFVEQGSFAMRTVVQHPENDYDIDNGVVFDRDALKRSNGTDMAPRAARQLIADSFKDERFKKDPEVKTNCVRFNYAAGYHVDMPVYRRIVPALFGDAYLEIASGDEWKTSKAQEVTTWFNDAVESKSPDTKNDGQMRRMVCLLKAVSKTRSTYDANWPSGFILSVLTHDKYVGDDRDDVAFVKLLRAIVARLKVYTHVKHPKLDKYLAQEGDASMIFMREKLAGFEAKFAELEADCSPGRALVLWGQIFNNQDWFEKRNAERIASIGISGGGAAAGAAAYERPKDANRWG